MKIPLSDRLLTCCSFVRPGDRVADIGCDHGYLGIHLLKQGIASAVIAADVNRRPLDSALRNAMKYGTRDKMRFYLSDGAVSIPRDFDVLVCAGMGADTMISILTASPWLRDGYRLILQCQSKTPTLRRWLSEHGCRICRETLVKDGKFIYSVMEVDGHLECPLTPAQWYLSPALLADASVHLPEYYRRIRNGLALNVEGMRRCGDEQLEVYQDILDQLTQMEDRIYGNGS